MRKTILTDESAAASSCSDVIGRLSTRFKVPLEAADAVVGLILGEFREMLSYATQLFPFQVLIIKLCGGSCFIVLDQCINTCSTPF